MAPRKSRQTSCGRSSRQQRKHQHALPAASALSHKLSSQALPTDTAPSTSPRRKKRRSQSSKEVLKELAANALREMKEQGFLVQSGYASQCDEISLYSCTEEKYDCLVASSSQVTMDECDEPQSPTSFFDRVGLKTATKSGFCKRRLRPLDLPPIVDGKKDLSMQFSRCPSECCSEKFRSSGVKTSDSFKNVTPATAEAAQYLLRLRG